MKMPEPDAGVIARRQQIIDAMQAIVSGEGVIFDSDELRAYDHDGLMAYKALPLIVVLPESTAQVSAILKYCHDNGVKIVPRGAGTGLSGGALPLADAITLGLGKFK
ncbi:MAG: FAD-binding protein, partial [Alphaproteobacteria bacterium]|nr:FAD-binding protein [Alphaproteobacteria bacterium]